MAKKRLILYSCLLALAAVFFYSSQQVVASISAKAHFISYHFSHHNNHLKDKHPLKSDVKIKVRYLGAEHYYATQNSPIIASAATINEQCVFIPTVSFVYKYHHYTAKLRGPPSV
ncbi:MAG: hypothetical protein ACTHJ0_12825 [Flavipsychrobacter sp.]